MSRTGSRSTSGRPRRGSWTPSSASSSTGASTRCPRGGPAGQAEYAEWYWNRITGARQQAEPEQSGTGSSTARTTARSSTTTTSPRSSRPSCSTPQQWAELFRDPGAKYVVPTSKHHDGFGLWPSAEAGHLGPAVERRRDRPEARPDGELAEAVRAQGLKFGFYYSLYEWYNPLWLTDRTRYVAEHMMPAVQGRRHPLPAVDHLQRRRVGHALGETGRARSCWPGCSTSRPARTRSWSTTAGARTAATSTAATGRPSTPPGMKDARIPGRRAAAWAFSYGYNRAERIDDYQTAATIT